MAVSKHFPGHGDTHEDSHLGLPVVDLPLSALENRELIPFEATVKAGISGVMSAHIAWPQLGGKDAWPATLEPKVITGLLREKLGFNGVVFTDALDMGGITRRAAAGEAAVRAMLAGCDVLLFPTDIPAMRRALVEAVESGRIPRAHFESSTARVLKARERWKTLRAAKPEDLSALLQTKEALALARECARRSIVRLRAAEKQPLEQVLVLHDPQEDWGFDRVPEAFLSALRAEGVSAPVTLCSGREPSAQEPCAAWSRALVLSAASLSPATGKDAAQAAARRRSLLQLAVKGGAAVVLLGNPLAHGSLPDGQGALLVGLDFDDHTQRALVLALMSGARAEGRLPLEVPGLAARGAGLGR
jgi:beta-N-acetylhexosaminidase